MSSGCDHMQGPARARGAGRGLRALAAGLVAAALLAVAAAPAGAVGYQDFSYSGVTAPTRDKPQNKLWFNDGVWWGSLYNRDTGAYEVYRLSRATESWSSTGTTLDPRDTSHADVLWDGGKLYVASVTDSGDARLFRLSYDAGADSYSLDAGYPATIMTGGTETITLAKDTTGRLWAAWTKSNRVWVAHTTTSDAAWGAPYQLPVSGAGNLNSDDIAAIVSYDASIGVLWSNQTDSRMYFAMHPDGASDADWSRTVVAEGPASADDHMNVKALRGDPAGRVFAVYKTSRNDAGAPGTDPLMVLAVLGNDGVWRRHTVGQVRDDHTRPTLVLDPEHRRVHVFFAAPCCSGGTIYHKESSLDSISFPEGLGTPFIQLASDPQPNNVTTTQQSVGSASGLVVMASDDDTRHYVHNSMSLGASDRTAPDTTITAGPPASSSDTAATFTFEANEPGASFECRLDAGAFAACGSPQSYAKLEPGAHHFEVRATDASGNVDATPATWDWNVTASGPLHFAAEADSYIDEARPSANRGGASALRVDGDSGRRQNTLLRFRVDGLDGSVASARLRVYVSNGTGNGPGVFGAASEWDELAVTWANRPARVTGAIDDLGAVASGAYAEYDVTSFVTGPGAYTFELATSSRDGIVMSSREALDNRPELVVTTGTRALRLSSRRTAKARRCRGVRRVRRGRRTTRTRSTSRPVAVTHARCVRRVPRAKRRSPTRRSRSSGADARER